MKFGWSLSRSRRRRGIPAACALVGALSLHATGALAGDGAYGRLDGDLELSASAGAAVTADAPAFVARAAALYVATAGLYFNYADAFGQSSARVDRSLSLGVTLKPLFWGRFASALENGPARLDLLIDSFLLEVGAFWAAPHGRAIEVEPGVELATGLAIPIFEEATGLFLEVRGALRLRRADLPPGVTRDPLERGALLSFAISWHHVVPAHIVDAGDRAPR